jgi:thiol-disulfide isomerase/thioredoxin
MKSSAIIILVIIITLIGFFILNKPSPLIQEDRIQPSELPSWIEFELTDINTQEKFKISQFNNPVLFESFAVWCPTCTKQQKEIKKLHEEIGDEFISISINTDANEDEDRVKEHIIQNEFNWRYSIAPTELTTLLRNEFGTEILFAPSAPVVLICPDHSYRKLKSGVKDVDELKEALDSCNS